MIFQIAKKILRLLSPEEKRRTYFLLFMILVMALLDVMGVASIMPFMALLADPSVTEENTYLQAIYIGLSFEDKSSFLFFVGGAVFAVIVTAIAFKALTIYAMLRFTFMREYSIGRRLVAGYLHQPYEWFLSRNSAELGKKVLSEVQQVVNGVLIPVLQLIAHGGVAISILTLLVIIDTKLAVVVATSLGTAYAVIYFLLRHKLEYIGVRRVRTNQQRFQVISEAFGGVKEVKVSGAEEAFLTRYDEPARRYARYQAASQVAAQIPRYILEVLAFGGMLSVILYLVNGPGGLEASLPVIAVYAFAGYRLMPALQQVYAQVTLLRFNGPALDELYNDFYQFNSPDDRVTHECFANEPGVELILENITYSYPGSDRTAVSGINLTIKPQTTVAFVGATGSGKTTIVDIILGLLLPQNGRLLVNQLEINRKNLRSWQKMIGYVPQHIYLSDDTVAANIAFGIPHDDINMSAVERAAKVANLHKFVSEELENGYKTVVGERGLRLSGGQRQRIGIARALYHDPQVLIMDEATSALDNVTERTVMEAVCTLGHQKTIILIAHRLSTVKECDRIFVIDSGVLVGEGGYSDLSEESLQFQKMLGQV